MSAGPAVSVVIPSRNRAQSLGRVFSALDGQEVPPGSFEVVVSLDGENDPSVRVLEGLRVAYPVRWIEAPHRGRAAARNAGAWHALGHLLWFLDDDLAPTPSCLPAHLAAHRGGGPAPRAVLGPVPVSEDGATPLAAFRGVGFAARHQRLTRGEPPRPVDVYAGNLSLPASAFRAAGGFDEAFDVYGHEDFELATRLVRQGVEIVYAPDAVALQFFEKGVRDFARDIVAEGRTAVRLVLLHPETVQSLPLGRYGRRGRPERAVLRALLALDRGTGIASSAGIGTVAALTRLGVAPHRLIARVFDYLYWHGVDQELVRAGFRGPLARRLEALRRASS